MSSPHLGPLDVEPGWRPIVSNGLRQLRVTRLWTDREVIHEIRTERLLRFALACVVGLLVAETVVLVVQVIPANWELGQDYRFYRDLGAQWLADGSYYLPRQLDGPYVARLMEDVLYPPNALYLFAPFAVLPAVLWWAVPISVSAYVLWTLRPPVWAWLLMVVLLMYPRAISAYLFGNTDMWAVAAIFAGIRWGWPVALLVLKPTYVPFLLPFVRRGAVWSGVVAVAVLSLPMLPLWFDYLNAMDGLLVDPSYSLGSVPLLLIPLVAYAASKYAWRYRSASDDEASWDHTVTMRPSSN